MTLWSRFSAWVLGALAVIAAVAGVYLRGRSSGKKAERTKATERDLAAERAKAETIQEAHNAATEVSRLPASAVRERLSQRWSRD